MGLPAAVVTVVPELKLTVAPLPASTVVDCVNVPPAPNVVVVVTKDATTTCGATTCGATGAAGQTGLALQSLACPLK